MDVRIVTIITITVVEDLNPDTVPHFETQAMLSAIGTFFAAFLPGAEDATQYRLAASLDGHEGAINAFAFNAGSSLLASGGSFS